MISTAFPNTRPANWNILAQVLICDSVSLPPSIDKGSFCWCSATCAPWLRVFAGDNHRENDQSDFLFYRMGSSDTVVMELWKEGVKVADLNSNTYGTYYNFGALANADLKGYLINWLLVYNAFGGGAYKIKATSTLLGVVYEFESTNFRLMLYNELAADKTIRLETWQDGYTESSPINFTGVNWYSQTRLPGTMRNKQPEFTTDNYKDSLRTINQIQDSITNTYQLELFELTEDMKDVVVENHLLANLIKVTDYSIDNNNRYAPTEVYPAEIEALAYRINEPGCNLVLKFTDKKQNIIKRNIF